jgi:hypothetical protein
MVKDYIGQLPVSCLGMRPVAYLSLKFASSPSARRFKPYVMMLDLGALSRFRPICLFPATGEKHFKTAVVLPAMDYRVGRL